MRKAIPLYTQARAWFPALHSWALSIKSAWTFGTEHVVGMGPESLISSSKTMLRACCVKRAPPL